MKLMQADLVALCERLNAQNEKEQRSLLYKMNKMYEGGGRPLIEEKIRAEFTDQKAVTELSGRLVTLNFMKKVIDKSAGVYNEPPSRIVVDENESDQELLELCEDAMRVNMIQKIVNRHLKMFKRSLKKFYADEMGRPRALVKLPHTYKVFNLKNTDPTSPDVVAEIIVDSHDAKDQIIHVWSDESFWICDGKGEVKLDEMVKLGNNGQNQIGSLPFEYRSASTTELEPIVEDDLYYLCLCLPIVLTDLFFATKYQCWSIIYTINADAANFNVNPSSILQLKGDTHSPQAPQVGQIKPTVDTDKVVKLIEATINLMLSSKGLSVGTLSTGQSASDTVSGVSKMLDSAEIVADKKDQQDLLLIDENDMWDKISKVMFPYWRVTQLLAREYNRQFSQKFRVAVVFKEPKAFLSEKERVEILATKANNGWIILEDIIQQLNPDWTETMVDDYILKLEKERERKIKHAADMAKAQNAGKLGEDSEDEEKDKDLKK